MRTCYTCIVNNYDELKEPINKYSSNSNWKFICYTDNPNIKIINPYEEEISKEESIWKIEPLKHVCDTIAKTARWHKINFHLVIDTEESMWIDGTFFINVELERWWRRTQGSDFTVVNHPFDKCAYKDIQSCIGGGKGDVFTLARQMTEYIHEGLPKDYGLIASGVMMRKKTKETKLFCEKWWQQIEKYTERDQPCFTYTKWKTGMNINHIDWDYTQMTEFIHVPHVHKQHIRKAKFKKK
jgi:hypothetical protein